MKKLIILFVAWVVAGTVAAMQPGRGYRGFVDWSNDATLDLGFLSADGGGGDATEIFTGLSTSHGYQFNDWLYVGGGAGFEYNLDWKASENEYEWHARYIIPLFAECRLDAKWNRFTPFFSTRLGANLAHHGGIYFSPIVGYRFNWGRHSAINLALGMTLYGRRYSYPEHVTHPDGGITFGQTLYSHKIETRFALRLGFEFQL